ncbi:hypothetical protein RIB2604_02601750 [Aspergillus luchuensis]|uniref:Uncharacterized protein n=1 Tax=Aspergillus kawachii TaxID=1069201 RepID=A0A146FRP1_ASPKA|nr:hypothetical protein RIB2604_02601750 [Aspergillus luchuensis]
MGASGCHILGRGPPVSDHLVIWTLQIGTMYFQQACRKANPQKRAQPAYRRHYDTAEKEPLVLQGL